MATPLPGAATSLLLLAVFTLVIIACLVLRHPCRRPRESVSTVERGGIRLRMPGLTSPVWTARLNWPTSRCRPR